MDLKKILQAYPKVCVSISGGVDSNVLLHKLVAANTQCNCQITAVHINYNNRDTCNDEVKFVEGFCKQMGVSLRVRHITEITRQRDAFRKEYEELTREIRFAEYAKENCPVLLGHNYDDTVENIISNIASRKNHHNLRGMTDRCVEKGVTVLRPLLHMHKSDIYKYATINGIPHLPDSTPKWCRRGKLRDHVIPALKEHEPNFVKGLLQIAECLQQNAEHVRDNPGCVQLPSNFVNVKNALYATTNKSIDDYVRRVTPLCGRSL